MAELNASLVEDIRFILKKHWGHGSFRPLQEEIILSVLGGNDTLAMLPTGGGKSVCFQVPGLKLGGVSIVVSPLIALMNDQVDNLRKRGISAVALTSALNKREIEIGLDNAAQGHVQFVYLSPERLENEDFLKRIAYLPVTLIAVDEAHCISQWGHDFRPSYRRIAALRNYFPGVPVMALTASATTRVANDIVASLGFGKHQVFRSSFRRENLRYVVQNEENKPARLIRLIGRIGGTGIVYVRNRKRTLELAAFLSRNNISAGAYHAGLNYAQRAEIQNSWLSGTTRVICATNAFGMGIDKPDVRFVVHFDIPDSVEAYFQEAGRAGRDGKVSYAALFYTQADIDRLEEQFRIAFPTREEIKTVYQSVCNYYQLAVNTGAGTLIDFDIERIASSYNLRPSLIFNAIRFLEKQGYVTMNDAGYEPSKATIRAGKETIYDFEIRSPKFEPLIKTILRSYGGMFEGYVHISEKELARRLKLSVAQVVEQLGQLSVHGLIDYVPQTNKPKLFFVVDRVEANFLVFDPSNYEQLKQRHRDRMEAMVHYVTNTGVCREVQLLQYFDEKGDPSCGHCDVCVERKKKSPGSVREKLIGLLSNQPRSLKEIDLLMSERSQTWIAVLNELVDEGTVQESGERYQAP